MDKNDWQKVADDYVEKQKFWAKLPEDHRQKLLNLEDTLENVVMSISDVGDLWMSDVKGLEIGLINLKSMRDKPNEYQIKEMKKHKVNLKGLKADETDD
tara:strand:+ start:428 stop:724 length:297 start_codon:yes stop_codon:yes gene_type:complete